MSPASTFLTPEVIPNFQPRQVVPAIGVSPPPDDPEATPAAAPDTVVVTMLPSSTVPDSPPTATATGSPHDTEPGECKAPGPICYHRAASALGGLALLSLVSKRWRERPQRPVKIWFFDVSKQVFGSVLVHIANVFMSMLTSGRLSIRPDPGAISHVARRAVTSVLMSRAEDYVPNPCSFYLLNLAIDVLLSPFHASLSLFLRALLSSANA